MPLFIDDTPIKATTPAKDVVSVLRNANLGIENIDWYSDGLLAIDTCTAEGESVLAELFIDDFDEIYDNQEADEDVTRNRIGRRILDFLASL